MITSSHNPKLKLIRALAGRARERRENGAFLAEGARLVEEALAAKWPFRFVLYGESLAVRGKSLVETLKSQGVETEQVTDKLLGEVCETETSQGVLAVLELPRAPASPAPDACSPKPCLPAPCLPVSSSLTFALIPDQMRDPGNLGTLIRAAAAAGVQAVLIPPETADAFSPKVVRAGMGAHFRIPVASLGWEEIRAYLTGKTVFLAEAGGQTPCWGADFKSPLALIVGGEADGASESAKRLANGTVNIPMPGKIESLNAGVAGAILMFEVVRQRSEAL